MEELIKLTGSRTDEDELPEELFGDISPFFMQNMEPDSGPSNYSGLLSEIYSGPTVDDVESALSYTNYGIQGFVQHENKREALDRISMVERSYLSKDHHHDHSKYTLRIKSSGNAMADDGYKWRKYGQKSIKNSPNPRSYYRCTNPRCNAKKQVERSMEDPDTLVITYEGLHLHFTYPFLFLNNHTDPPIKKQKGPIVEAQTEIGLQETSINLDQCPLSDPNKESERAFMGQQGMLEDMVPLMVRKPMFDSTSSNSSSSTSHESDLSSPASSISFSWSPTYSYLGLI